MSIFFSGVRLTPTYAKQRRIYFAHNSSPNICVSNKDVYMHEVITGRRIRGIESHHNKIEQIRFLAANNQYYREKKKKRLQVYVAKNRTYTVS